MFWPFCYIQFMISVLFEGVHDNHHGDGYYDIDPLTSSVTLIQNEGLNILVDTGTPKFFSLLKEKLAEHKLKPEDIHYIFNSHYHLDHCGNDAFFPNAEVMMGRSTLDYKTGLARIWTDLSKLKYPGGVEMILTPGHTMEHAVYLYEENGIRYICAGDALREDIIRRQKIPPVHMPQQFVLSMKMIFEKADVIIPGHGRIIEDRLKEELYQLVFGNWSMLM